MSEEDTQEAAPQENAEQLFEIKKLYIKDASFESPNAPVIFTDGEWKPEVNIQLKGSNSIIEQDIYEVVLTITITVKQNDKTAFLVEIQQAGIFVIRGYPEVALKNLLGAFCLETLFPFAREAISSIVRNGGFPQLLLSPVNFTALYQQQLETEQAAQSGQEVAE